MEKDAPLCTTEMTCTKGCPCAGPDGICHCPMKTDKVCMCNGKCQV